MIRSRAGHSSFRKAEGVKQYFIASICREGILGGGIAADDEGITFKTGKATVSPRLKNLEMKYRDIQHFSKRWVLCFLSFQFRWQTEKPIGLLFSAGNVFLRY